MITAGDFVIARDVNSKTWREYYANEDEIRGYIKQAVAKYGARIQFLLDNLVDGEKAWFWVEDILVRLHRVDEYLMQDGLIIKEEDIRTNITLGVSVDKGVKGWLVKTAEESKSDEEGIYDEVEIITSPSDRGSTVAEYRRGR